MQRRHASMQAQQTVLEPRIDVDALRLKVYGFIQSNSHDDPEETWTTYEAIRRAGRLDTIELGDSLRFVHRILAFAESRSGSDDMMDRWTQWGQRAQSILTELEPSVPAVAHDQQRRMWQIHMTRALALRGQVDEAVEMSRRVSSLEPEMFERKYIVTMYRTLVGAMTQLRDPTAVLELAIHDWSTLGTYLDKRSVMVSRTKTSITGVTKLRQQVVKAITSMESTVAFMRDAEHLWPVSWRQRAGELITDFLTDMALANEAVALLRELYRQGLHVPGYQQLGIVRALAKNGNFELANPMFVNLENKLENHHGQLERNFLETGLYLFSRQGDTERTQHFFRAVRDEGGNDHRCVAQLLHAHAIAGVPERTVKVFETYCIEEGDPPPGCVQPNIVHYTAVILSFAKVGDRAGMNLWLERMARGGFIPDKHLYTIILEAFASQGEVASVGAVLQQMRASDVMPRQHAYTTVISLLAQRRDPIAAEAIYKQAVEEGVVPDRRMISALLHAHVEAGSWSGVINAFDYLVASARGKRLDLSIDVYNTLLKAYVLIGAPFNTVFRLFHRLEQMNVRPNVRTFALIIQSAVDNNNMPIAEKIYENVLKMSRNWENSLQVTVYMLTILISGWLRLRNEKKARKTYKKMLDLGIKPTPHTFRATIKALALRPDEAGLQAAVKFVEDLFEMDPEKNPWAAEMAKATVSDVDALYGPLLQANNLKARPEEVERLLQEMLDRGAEPTLINLGKLLDVYRRTGNIEGVQEVWKQVHELALELSNIDTLFTRGEAPKDDPFRPDTRRQANVLCVLLSVYIDAMSAAGLHLEIARVWQQMRTDGFTFDAHNWNHLAVALIRAGQVERAFEVIEKVILPTRSSVQQFDTVRDENPSSPLISDRETPPVDATRPVVQWPMHSGSKRAEVAAKTRKLNVATDMVNKPKDFAHPLHILQQISPAWQAWRPHVETLYVLGEVLEHLQNGFLVQPVRTAGEPVPEEHESDEVRALQAEELLLRIYDKYPRTVDIVTRHMDWHRRHGHKQNLRRKNVQ
jgi:pentatricopeptide repeat-containing protein PET309